MTQRDSDEFLFECDGVGHDHDGVDDDGELVLTPLYLANHQVFELGVVTGVLHFSEEFITQLKGEYESPHPIATLNIATMDDKKHIMMIDENQAIDIVTQLLEWVTRLSDKEGGE